MNRAGVVLVEALVALAVLSFVGVASLGRVAAILDAQTRLHDREAEMARAERTLAATALLSRAELEQRIGAREVAGFVVWVDRPRPSLFRVGVAPPSNPAAELLVTLVYRPRESSS